MKVRIDWKKVWDEWATWRTHTPVKHHADFERLVRKHLKVEQGKVLERGWILAPSQWPGGYRNVGGRNSFPISAQDENPGGKGSRGFVPVLIVEDKRPRR